MNIYEQLKEILLAFHISVSSEIDKDKKEALHLVCEKIAETQVFLKEGNSNKFYYDNLMLMQSLGELNVKYSFYVKNKNILQAFRKYRNNSTHKVSSKPIKKSKQLEINQIEQLIYEHILNFFKLEFNIKIPKALVHFDFEKSSKLSTFLKELNIRDLANQRKNSQEPFIQKKYELQIEEIKMAFSNEKIVLQDQIHILKNENSEIEKNNKVELKKLNNSIIGLEKSKQDLQKEINSLNTKNNALNKEIVKYQLAKNKSIESISEVPNKANHLLVKDKHKKDSLEIKPAFYNKIVLDTQKSVSIEEVKQNDKPVIVGDIFLTEYLKDCDDLKYVIKIDFEFCLTFYSMNNKKIFLFIKNDKLYLFNGEIVGTKSTKFEILGIFGNMLLDSPKKQPYFLKNLGFTKEVVGFDKNNNEMVTSVIDYERVVNFKKRKLHLFYLLIKNNNKMGVLTSEGNICLNPIYSTITFYENNVCLFENELNAKYYLEFQPMV